MQEQGKALSIGEWIAKAAVAAYGVLKLKPWEFEELSIMDFNQMLDAHNEAKQAERWETAYWVSQLISVHTKRAVTPEALMEPFNQKTREDILAEREAFFREFGKQRKEALNG